MQPLQKSPQKTLLTTALRSAFLVAIVISVLALAGRYPALHRENRISGRITAVARLGIPSSAATGRPRSGGLQPHSTSNRNPAATDHKAASAAGKENQSLPPDHAATTSAASTTSAAATQAIPAAGHDTAVSSEPGHAASSAPAAGTGATGQPANAPDNSDKTSQSNPPATRKHDWTKCEITGAIPNANIVIYLRQRILLLRSYADYVRIYRNIAVPTDIAGPKTKAGDKRAPIGNYYIATREKTGNNFLLAIAYPSTADADKALRAGIIDDDAAKKIKAANRRRAMPPQDTALGGNIRITGQRETIDKTNGGFALYPGQMEELWTAVKIGTPVIIVK